MNYLSRVLKASSLSYLLFVFILTVSTCLISSCSLSSEVGEELPYYVTDPSALDPEGDPAMIDALLKVSSGKIRGVYQKGHSRASLDDSMIALIRIAEGMVSDDPAKHIPYVWGGKRIDKPTKWSTPPASNDTGCKERVGLDCSGFVQLLFEKAGFGREASELNAASLSMPDSWDILTKRGYFVTSLWRPKYEDLLPGDVLFFGTENSIWHTGIYWSKSASINGNVGHAMINSLGRSRCDSSYARENAGILTGVLASPLGPDWQSKLVSAIRVIGHSYLDFGIDGNVWFAKEEVGHAVFDSVDQQLLIAGGDEIDSTRYAALLVLHVPNFKIQTGKQSIPEIPYNSSEDRSDFHIYGEDGSVSDSLLFSTSAPPSNWEGATPPRTGGEIDVQGITKTPGFPIGAITATFNVRMNSYFYRYVDTIYVRDSVQVKDSTLKSFFLSKEVKGKIGGAIIYP